MGEIMKLNPVVALLVFAAAAACLSSQPQGLAATEPCAGRACLVSLINHSTSNLSIRYADSTGRRTLVGRVGSLQTLAFKVQFVHSAGVRVFATDQTDGHTYAADVTLAPAGPIELHFPDNFTAIDDTITAVRKP
jgi:hypothetical protein